MRGVRAYGSRVTNRREILVIPVITSRRASIRRACLLAGGSLTRARYSRDTDARWDARSLVQFASVDDDAKPEQRRISRAARLSGIRFVKRTALCNDRLTIVDFRISKLIAR